MKIRGKSLFQNRANPPAPSRYDGGGKVIIAEFDAISLDGYETNRGLLEILARHQSAEGDMIVITDDRIIGTSVKDILGVLREKDQGLSPDPETVLVLSKRELEKNGVYAFTVFATGPVSYVGYNHLMLVRKDTGGIAEELDGRQYHCPPEPFRAP